MANRNDIRGINGIIAPGPSSNRAAPIGPARFFTFFTYNPTLQPRSDCDEILSGFRHGGAKAAPIWARPGCFDYSQAAINHDD